MKQPKGQFDRNKFILNEYKGGRTLNSLASEFKITRSRVQQIVVRELEKEMLAQFKLSDIDNEEKKLLAVAVHEIVDEIRQNRQNKQSESGRRSLKEAIVNRQTELPYPTIFSSVSGYAKALGVEVSTLAKHFPDVVKQIKEANEKKWSKVYNQCRTCGTISRKHHSLGYCTFCYTKSDEFKEMQRSSRERNIEKLRRQQKIYAAKYHKRPEVIEKIKHKLDLQLYGGNRIKVLEKNNFTCSRCGMTQEESQNIYKRDLYVIHKDRNKENNEIENLDVVCRGCFTFYKFKQTEYDFKPKTFQFKNKRLKEYRSRKHFREKFISTVINKNTNQPSNISVYLDNITLEPSLQNLLLYTAKLFHVRPAKVFKRTRLKRVVLPRQVFMYILKTKYKFSFPKIAKIFNQDHTTIMHACKKIQKLSTTDNRIRDKIDILVNI